MLKLTNINPIARAVGVMSAVGILVSGVTFAALNSQVTLTGNTLSVASAGLEIDNIENGVATGQTTDEGYNFDNMVPGGGFGEAHTFTLTNTGEADMNVTVLANSGDEVSVMHDEESSDPEDNTIDPTLVFVKFTNTATGQSRTYTLDELKEGDPANMPGVSGNGLNALNIDETATFTVQVKLGKDAVNGDSAEDAKFDFVFTGTAVGGTVSPTPPPVSDSEEDL